MSLEARGRSTIEAMRERVERSLRYRLQMFAVKIPHSAHMLELNLDELPMFVALGALTDEEAEAWRERFTAAALAASAPDGEVVPDAQRTRARALLEEVLAAYKSAPASDERPFLRFPATLRTLKAVGAVPEDEAFEWDHRFHEVLTEKSRPRREARERAKRKARRESGAEVRRYAATELHRVVAGPAQRLSGVRVTCVELYGDCVIVRWRRVLSREELRHAENACSEATKPDKVAAIFGAAFSLTDDRATPYEPAERAHQITGDLGYVEDGPVAVWGRSVFLPAVPDSATNLTASNGNDVFWLPLTGEGVDSTSTSCQQNP